MKPSKILLLSLFIPVFLATACVPPSQSVRQEKKESEFHYKMGLAYMSEGDTQNAFVHFQKALQEDPKNKDVMNNLGLIYITLKNLEAAKELFLRAIALDSSFSDAYNNLGVVYMQQEKWQEAIEAFKKATSNPLYEAPGKALYNLGTAYYRTEQFRLAIDSFKGALLRAPLFPSPYYGLALAYNRIEHYGDAASAVARGIELDPAYQGNRKKFAEALREKLATAKGADERELREFLEILKY